jgi:hypothetical protein
MKRTEFKQNWDEETALRNPHKGWYHHYFDNGITKYIPKNDEELKSFPCLDHIYLRLAWSFLEPKYQQYNWKLIDDVIEKWVAKGLGVSFRISCKESGVPCYATPEWVKDAGAQGSYHVAWGDETWRPDYGDPIFLRYLDEFHAAFAARYDGQPWLEYVDIGSYGQWGEGHNFMCGDDHAPIEVVKQHIDIYRKHYKNAPLVISDDVVGNRDDDKGPELANYIVQNGISFRDDSIGVRFYLDNYPHDSVRSPELFERVYGDRATVLELQHYHMMKSPELDNSWRGPEGSEYGAEYFENAIRSMRATYIGYHGYAREWLADNAKTTLKFANLCGYWFFPESAESPQEAKVGSPIPLNLTWLNRGVAPAYHRYVLKLQLRDEKGKVAHQQILSGCNVTQWMPQQSVTESYQIDLSDELPTGEYSMEIGLWENETPNARPVMLALKPEMKTTDNFYRIGSLQID